MSRIKVLPKLSGFQLLVHAASLAPLAFILVDYFNNNLTVNPIQELTFRTGKTALVLLVCSLACTPLNTIFRFRPALKVRRALGLYAVFYARLHLRPGSAAGSDFRKTLCAGWLCRFSSAPSACGYLNQRLDETSGQEMDAFAPAGLCGRSIGRDSLPVAGEIGHPGSAGLCGHFDLIVGCPDPCDAQILEQPGPAARVAT
jgi:hypothetical protein